MRTPPTCRVIVDVVRVEKIQMKISRHWVFACLLPVVVLACGRPSVTDRRGSREPEAQGGEPGTGGRTGGTGGIIGVGAEGGDDTGVGGDTGVPAGCGDRSIDGMEECDDGNNEDGDGCTADCREEDGFDCVVAGE